jgi:hypothetical protein
MAITEAYAISETVSTTEWSFTTDTSGPDADTNDGVYQGFFDVSAIANGDVFRFRVYEKVLSAGTQWVAFEAVLANAQAEPIFVTPSLILLHGWDMTWLKVSGSDRNIDGSIRKVA